MIVSATLRNDLERPGSNFGDCIDINAPGDSIPSPWIGPSNQEENFLSGSSASASIVSGIVGRMMAILKSKNNSMGYVLKHSNNGEIAEEFITLHEEIQKIPAADVSSLIRNLILSTKFSAILPANVRDFHPDPLTICDLRGVDSVLTAAQQYVKRTRIDMGKQSPLTRIKSNFQNQQKSKLEALYDE